VLYFFIFAATKARTVDKGGVGESVPHKELAAFKFGQGKRITASGETDKESHARHPD